MSSAPVEEAPCPKEEPPEQSLPPPGSNKSLPETTTNAPFLPPSVTYYTKTGAPRPSAGNEHLVVRGITHPPAPSSPAAGHAGNASHLVFVGDLHGCADEAALLLAKAPVRSIFIFVGDIVHKGPKSFEALRLVRALVSGELDEDDNSQKKISIAAESLMGVLERLGLGEAASTGERIVDVGDVLFQDVGARAGGAEGAGGATEQDRWEHLSKHQKHHRYRKKLRQKHNVHLHDSYIRPPAYCVRGNHDDAFLAAYYRRGKYADPAVFLRYVEEKFASVSLVSQAPAAWKQVQDDGRLVSTSSTEWCLFMSYVLCYHPRVVWQGNSSWGYRKAARESGEGGPLRCDERRFVH